MQSLKVCGPFRSVDFQTLLVLGPFQKLLLLFTFRSSVTRVLKVVSVANLRLDEQANYLIFSAAKYILSLISNRIGKSLYPGLAKKILVPGSPQIGYKAKLRFSVHL